MCACRCFAFWFLLVSRSSTTYIKKLGSDVYASRLGVCFLVGGAWPDNTRCGLWCWNTNAASSNTNINYGARLLIIKFLTHHFP